MEAISSFLHQGASTIVPFIVLLGALIFVHELGHFSVAKFFGVRVETFSLGFGRKIFRKKWGDTTYCVSIIPFGGYVKMFGDETHADIPASERRYSFSHQSVLRRIAIVLAGPVMNAFFALFLFIVIARVGEEVLRPRIGDVFSNTKAYEVGFRTDDTIVKINNEPVDRWDQVKKAVEDNPNSNLDFTVRHDNKEFVLHATTDKILNKNILVPKTFVGEIDGLSFLTRGSAVGISDPLSPAAKSGLKTGDIVRKVEGQEITRWTELESALKKAEKERRRVKLDVERNGAKDLLSLNLDFSPPYSLAGLEPSELYLSNIMPKSAADQAGLQVGDRLVSINGFKLQRWDDVIHNIQSYKPALGPLKITYSRDGKAHDIEIVPKMISQTDAAGVEQKNFALGVVTAMVSSTPDSFIAKETELPKMIMRGASEAAHWTFLTAYSFVKLAQGKVPTKSIGGPLMIGKLASDTWRIGVSPFLKIMGIISINLFLLNLLPVPVLDGGHLLFFGIELLKGSPLSIRKMEIMNQVGLFLLLALMVYSMFNDIVRFFTAS